MQVRDCRIRFLGRDAVLDDKRETLPMDFAERREKGTGIPRPEDKAVHRFAIEGDAVEAKTLGVERAAVAGRHAFHEPGAIERRDIVVETG
jgi:hypothetical protein